MGEPHAIGVQRLGYVSKKGEKTARVNAEVWRAVCYTPGCGWKGQDGGITGMRAQAQALAHNKEMVEGTLTK